MGLFLTLTLLHRHSCLLSAPSKWTHVGLPIYQPEKTNGLVKIIASRLGRGVSTWNCWSCRSSVTCLKRVGHTGKDAGWIQSVFSVRIVYFDPTSNGTRALYDLDYINTMLLLKPVFMAANLVIVIQHLYNAIMP